MLGLIAGDPRSGQQAWRVEPARPAAHSVLGPVDSSGWLTSLEIVWEPTREVSPGALCDRDWGRGRRYLGKAAMRESWVGNVWVAQEARVLLHSLRSVHAGSGTPSRNGSDPGQGGSLQPGKCHVCSEIR